MENLATAFGKKFVNNKLEEVSIESLQKINVIGIFFTGSWCPPCQTFANDLVNVYIEANSKEKILEIIQVSNEKNESDFKNSLDDKPWLFVHHNEPMIIQNLVGEYKINYLPMLIIINKDRVILSETGRKDVVDLGVKACEKWYKLYRIQKERDKEIEIQNI